MLRILLINSDKPEPIQFFQKDKETNDSINISVITRSCYAPLYSHWADHVYIVDDVTDLTVMKSLMLEILKVGPIDHIVSTTEKSILTGGFLRAYFGIAGPGFETALYMTNKLAMKTKLKMEGIPVADFLCVSQVEDIPAAGEKLGWPIIVKPALGSGALNTFIIHSLDHYEDLYSTSGGLGELKKNNSLMIAEKCIEMEEFHCDTLYADGEILFVSISKYTVPLLKGMAKIQGSFILSQNDPVYAEILELQKSVAQAFRITDGPGHLEIYRTHSGELIVGEIAMRIGGGGISRMIEKKFNISLWESSLNISVYRDPNLTVNPIEGTVGYFSLPCRNGTIKEFTPIEEWEKLAGILEVELLYQEGDVVDEKQSSSFDLARLYFCLENENEVQHLLALVKQTYYLHLTEDHMMNQ
ncbi:ATP-grasp domain-containing protein [Bacillus spizizenii]|nr:ATP-grasp domain-containing protein [Bacillus spizizenii]